MTQSAHAGSSGEKRMAIARTVGEAEFRTLMLAPAKREVERRGSMSASDSF